MASTTPDIIDLTEESSSDDLSAPPGLRLTPPGLRTHAKAALEKPLSKEELIDLYWQEFDYEDEEDLWQKIRAYCQDNGTTIPPDYDDYRRNLVPVTTRLPVPSLSKSMRTSERPVHTDRNQSAATTSQLPPALPVPAMPLAAAARTARMGEIRERNTTHCRPHAGESFVTSSASHAVPDPPSQSSSVTQASRLVGGPVHFLVWIHFCEQNPSDPDDQIQWRQRAPIKMPQWLEDRREDVANVRQKIEGLASNLPVLDQWLTGSTLLRVLPGIGLDLKPTLTPILLGTDCWDNISSPGAFARAYLPSEVNESLRPMFKSKGAASETVSYKLHLFVIRQRMQRAQRSVSATPYQSSSLQRPSEDDATPTPKPRRRPKKAPPSSSSSPQKKPRFQPPPSLKKEPRAKPIVRKKEAKKEMKKEPEKKELPPAKREPTIVSSGRVINPPERYN